MGELVGLVVAVEVARGLGEGGVGPAWRVGGAARGEVCIHFHARAQQQQVALE